MEGSGHGKVKLNEKQVQKQGQSQCIETKRIGDSSGTWKHYFKFMTCTLHLSFDWIQMYKMLLMKEENRVRYTGVQTQHGMHLGKIPIWHCCCTQPSLDQCCFGHLVAFGSRVVLDCKKQQNQYEMQILGVWWCSWDPQFHHHHPHHDSAVVLMGWWVMRRAELRRKVLIGSPLTTPLNDWKLLRDHHDDPTYHPVKWLNIALWSLWWL